MTTEVDAALREVAEQGAPAQSAHAAALLARISSEPMSGDLMQEARLLIDAYRNDPYLWR